MEIALTFFNIYSIFYVPNPNHQVHEKWRNKLQTTMDAAALETYCEQVVRCIEMALSCVETDRHKRPSIGAIIDELNKMETNTDQV